ncbi:2-oxoacid:acceptor oxidoreductase family protein [Thermoproteus tenax]|uniref:pyruvate synthase n=2 Tax=Thermoproteus tenax TaxID=2271 RepID=G4RLF7_THETK|nr:2-oxoacid:acceptor oxidoreductase family protein [Thermoproteus tenax]CAF18499.1 pyruvate-ferredoxin oxidoreductase and related 2-oxoacid-ferredoxin oxidoreductases gamma subunit [Thermoproteus tenax]CCC82402.1 2-oxoacid ferredoxin oxidoreductase, gamma subunit [Thermoproteus tenax Kra 1]
MIEVVFFGRGGMGAVTAAQLLARVATIEGKFGQAIPEFGAERRGAIVRAYLRIDERPIEKHSSITAGDYVVVLDGRILRQTNVKAYGKPEARYIVNTKEEEPWYIAVDATSIALKHGLVAAGWPLVNMVMAAAFAAVSKAVSIEGIIRTIPEFVPARAARANIEAAKEAYEVVSKKLAGALAQQG